MRHSTLVRFLLAAGVCLFMLGLERPAPAQTWIELSPVGSPPDPVYDAKSVFYDAANNRLIVFFPGNPPFNPNPPGNGNEVWVLTNANGLGGTPIWTKLLPTGSPPFSNAWESVAYDPGSNRLTVYGGCFANCSPALSNVFVLTNANGFGGPPVWSETTVTNPQARAGLSSVYDSANNLMISFGGNLAFFGTDHNDTRLLSNANGLLSPSVWTSLGTSGGPPLIRSTQTASYDQPNNRMTIFGGFNYITTCCPYVIDNLNDTWVLSNANGQGGTPTWAPLSPLGTLPTGRGSHAAVYDAVNNRILVFGGDHWDQAAQLDVKLGDLWQLSNANGLGGTSTWTQLLQLGTPPGPRSTHTTAFDAAHQRMILLGGRDSTETPSNRVWILDLNPPSCVEPPTGLVGWWPGDGNANDIAGGNNGTPVNGTAFVPGLVGQAFSFDGVNDYVEIPSTANLQIPATLTVDAWINLAVDMTTHGDWQSATIVAKGFDAEAPVDWALTVTGAGNSATPGTLRPHVMVNGNWTYFDCNTVLQPHTWYHVAMTYDGSSLRGYLNGVLDGVIPATGAIQTTDSSLRCGAYAPVNAGPGGSQHFFPGLIDEVEVFNRALTATEVHDIFNAGGSGKCKNDGLTELGSANVRLGLKNVDDVGTKFDLLAEVFKNGSPVGSGQLNGVSGGGSGFNNAVLRTIDLALFAPTDVHSGDTLSVRFSVRIAAGVSGHRSGTARLWFNDLAANSRFDATIGGTPNDYFLLDGFTLGSTAGPGPKKTIDVSVDRLAGGNPFKPFGTWSKTF